jgi:hypothetical protein
MVIIVVDVVLETDDIDREVRFEMARDKFTKEA